MEAGEAARQDMRYARATSTGESVRSRCITAALFQHAANDEGGVHALATRCKSVQATLLLAIEAFIEMVKTAKKASVADTTLTFKEIGVSIAEQFELPKSHAQEIMATTVAMMQKQLKKGGKVRISGLGILQVRKTAARNGVNPATGASIKIKAGKRLKFSADRGFKASL